jgi:ABC-2 type transport system permease protein
MNNIWQIISAEVVKQHRNSFHSRMVYFSLLIWPIITFFDANYSYKPFNLTSANWANFHSEQSILSFLIVGLFGSITFRSLVQSAWQMGFERQNGTLEILFLTPANRLALIYGRALGALFENVWMFLIFSVLVVLFVGGISVSDLVYLPFCFLVVLVAALVWGGLLNVVFLFSRDASVLFTILDEPMVLFSGVRIPTFLFPLWAKVISVVFPLTYILVIMRRLLLDENLGSLVWNIVGLVISNVTLIGLTVWLLKKAEGNARRNGELSFY